MGEKRKHMRFNVLMDAIFRKGGASKQFKVNNFSREGIGVLSEESLDEGEDVEVELMIPGDNMPVIFEGKIAWVSGSVSDSAKYRGGIQFKNLSSGDRGRLMEYIYQKWLRPSRDKTK